MAWYKRLVNLMRSERLSRDLEREVAFHLSERADEHLQEIRGLMSAKPSGKK